MKLPLRYLLPAVVALGALMLVFDSRVQRIDFAEHVRFDQKLNALERHNSRLNRDLLKARFRVTSDYDSLNAEIASLRQLVVELAEMPSMVTAAGREPLRRELAAFGALLTQKEQLIARFAAQNAVLNNSLRYLPTASTDVLAMLASDEESRGLQGPLTRLMQQVFVHCVQAGDDQKTAIDQSLTVLAGWLAAHPAHPQADEVRRIVAHVGSIVTRKLEVETLSEQLAAIPTGQSAREMLRLYEAQLALALQNANLLRTVLGGLCALLLPGIGYTIYALVAAKRHLERRVVARTAELSDENAQRQRAEEEHREARRFIQSTLDALSSHIAILDATGTIVAVNGAWRQFAEMNGAPGGAFGIGTNYLAVCEAATGDCSTEAAAMAAGIRRVMAGEEKEFQIEYPCHGPQEQRWFCARVTCFRGEGSLHMVVAHENVTARARAEHDLRVQEAELRALFDLLPAMICFKDTSNRILRVNRPLAEAAGKSVEDFAGKTTEEMFSEDAARYFAEDQEVIRSGSSRLGAIEMRRTPEGEERWFQIDRVPYRDGAGKVAGIVISVQDVTDRKRAELELETLHTQLLETSRHAGMAEVATGVLHNVGNVLNSVNVSATLVADSARKSKVRSLGRVVSLLDHHAVDLGTFLTSDPQGRNLPNYLRELNERLVREQADVLAEVESLRQNIDHIKDIVSMQQDYARVSGVAEVILVTDLVEDSLRMNSAALARHGVTVEREYQEVPPICIDKHKALQILVNIIRNAKYACDEAGRPDKRVAVRVARGAGRIRITVADNGVGIPPENLTRIFNHGFTTRKDGHGFGLHSGALAARELGGSLSVCSDGVGHGATFILELPEGGPAA